MRLEFNENSFVNNSCIRGINYAFIIVYSYMMLGLLMSGFNIETHPTPVGLEVVVAAAISSLLIGKVIRNTTFYEWDFTERKKRTRFIVKYVSLNFIFTFLFVHELAFAIYNFDYITSDVIFIMLEILLLLWFGFNACNIISLYYTLFKKELTPAYKIQKKPEHWQDDDNGVELPQEEPSEERFRREFGL